MAEGRLKNRESTNGPDESFSKKRRAHSFRRFFSPLAGAILFGATYFNFPHPNQAMAQPEQTQAPSESQLRERANEAVAALRNFVLTGRDEHREAFMRVWQANQANDVFFDRFQQGIRENPDVFRNLLVAYQNKHGGWPMPEELAAAVQDCYSELRRPQAQRERDRVVAFHGEAFVAEMERIMAGRVAPVRVPSQIDDQILRTFLDAFSVRGLRSGASSEEMMRSLVLAVKDSFAIREIPRAIEVTQALLHGYTLLGGEDRRLYVSWIRQLNADQKREITSVVISTTRDRSLRLPYEYVRDQFERWKQSREAQQERISQMQADLARYPGFIREGSLGTMSSNFASRPNDYLLENMIRRLEYVRRKIEMLQLRGRDSDRQEIANLRREIGALEAWLGTLGLSQGTAEARLDTLRAGLVAIQNLYYTSTPSDPQLVSYLTNVSSNRVLFAIYKRYLLSIDSRTARIFEGIDASSAAFLERIGDRLQTRLVAERVRSGQAQWYNEYYPALAPQQTTVAQSPMEAQMYNRIANLDPLLASAFVDYLEVASRNGLTSSEEHRLVVATVARLYAINPLLAVKYFYAIKNLADVCEDNVEAFRQSLVALSARIDAQTDAVISRVSPTQIFPLNVRRMVSNLERALEDIAGIERSSVAQYDRLNLLDDRLFLRPYPPHSIEQRPPGYAPRLLVDERRPSALYPPYPFPQYLPVPTPSTPFTGGGVFTNPTAYGGALQLPTFRPLDVFTGAASVGTAMRYYLEPEHPIISINQFLPGVNIPALSPTKLLNEINRAFIPTEMPEYSRQVIGGGGGAGVAGIRREDEWEVGGGGLGTIITPTGGASFGGAGTAERQFGGISAVAVPVAIPILSGPQAHRRVTGLDSAIAGYEQFDSGTKRLLLRAIETQWDPNNPSQMLFVLNGEQVGAGEAAAGRAEGRFMTARYFFMDRSGMIFELKGGLNDFVDALNFAAGYGNQNFETPTTYAWNVEPTIERGGGVLTVDIGRTPILAHAQAVPFFVPQGQPQPFLLQWTAAVATTVPHEGGAVTDIHQISLPGKMLRIRPGRDGSSHEDFIMQDTEYMMRRVRRESAWELRLGGAYAHTPIGPAGRGGFFIRSQAPRSTRAGGGLFYEGGATNFEALALLEAAEAERRYIESLHRIGMTVYGSREAADRLVIGGLSHVVAQLKEEMDRGVQFDTILYRLTGLLMGVRSAARLDVSRFTGLDQMMLDYEQMGRQIGDDPSRAAELMTHFTERYARDLRQVFDNYSLAIQINRDFSMEAALLMREDENRWTGQTPENVAGRVLFTWRTGFWRAFASIPLAGPATLDVRQDTGEVDENGRPVYRSYGIAGSGVGQDLLNGLFLQRAALDAGVIVARAESGDRTWQETGFFTQGAIRVFSNVLEDSRRYRRLVGRFEEYSQSVAAGRFSDIPQNVRNEIAEALEEEMFSEQLIARIRRGEDVRLSPLQAREAGNALWREWFYDEKMELQQRFNGHLRVFLAASGYFFSDRTYWDIGTFIEHVDRFRAYIIVSKRERYAVHAGTEVTAGRVRVGVMAGAGESEEEAVDLGIAGSVGVRFGPDILPMEVGLYGYGRSSTVPDYAAPFYPTRERHMTPEFGGLIYFTLGFGAGNVPQFQGPSQPYRLNY
jgi:hypothetical protein